jgi:hypothetical protein
MTPGPDNPPLLVSSQVMVRAALRLLLLGSFALVSPRGFAPALSALLPLMAIYCLVVGTFRREAVFGSALTNWDEAALYLGGGIVAAKLA